MGPCPSRLVVCCSVWKDEGGPVCPNRLSQFDLYMLPLLTLSYIIPSLPNYGILRMILLILILTKNNIKTMENPPSLSPVQLGWRLGHRQRVIFASQCLAAQVLWKQCQWVRDGVELCKTFQIPYLFGQLRKTFHLFPAHPIINITSLDWSHQSKMKGRVHGSWQRTWHFWRVRRS